MEKSAVREIEVKSRQCNIIESEGINVKSVNKKKRNCLQYKIVLRGEVR